MKLTKTQINQLKKLMKASAQKGNLANGALLLDKNNKTIGMAESWVVSSCNATAHSEHLLVELACKLQNSHFTRGFKIVSVVEPCLMCLSAASQAGIEELAYIIPAQRFIKEIPWMSDVVGVDKHELCKRFQFKILFNKFECENVFRYFEMFMRKI
ncbi:MAG: hypothetical protein Fur003_5830 [Candidatus Dojkabacteria bacterium]